MTRNQQFEDLSPKELEIIGTQQTFFSFVFKSQQLAVLGCQGRRSPTFGWWSVILSCCFSPPFPWSPFAPQWTTFPNCPLKNLTDMWLHTHAHKQFVLCFPPLESQAESSRCKNFECWERILRSVKGCFSKKPRWVEKWVRCWDVLQRGGGVGREGGGGVMLKCPLLK